MNRYQLFINGKFVETKEKQNIINPSTGKVIAETGIASLSEVDLAISSARKAFDEGEWPKLSLEERKGFLLKIKQGILDCAAELASIESANSGKPIKETTFMDIPSSAKVFEDLANRFESYLHEENINVSEAAKANLRREPVGVVVLIVPWNYPLLIASWKLAQALAAGNTVVIKPSSLTPLSLLILARIIKEAELPDGVVNIINGSGSAIGEALCSDKRVDMVSFTGSNEVGRQILNYSSRNIKKLTMELGGKSASLIFSDIDIDTAVNASLCSIFLNQGQMCTAMSRIFVEESIFDKFTQDFVDKAMRIKLGVSENYETQMGPLISDGQRKRVIAFLEKAKAEGAKLLCGGKIPKAQDLINGYFFEPTVIANVNTHSHIFKEEVFGPVVIINEFSSIEEAVRLANDSDFGLASCVWTKDLSLAEDLAKRINAGTVWINTYGMFYNELPYGGFKQSGFGKELGREGFLEYTRLKNIVIDQTPDAKPLVNYWYGF